MVSTSAAIGTAIASLEESGPQPTLFQEIESSIMESTKTIEDAMLDNEPVREVIHDLRNRLSAIAAAAVAIRKSNFEQELGAEMVEIIRSNIERASESLNDLARQENARN